jgi:hypothetical protein
LTHGGQRGTPIALNREIFDAIMLIYKGLQSQRADIARGIFGAIKNGEGEDDIVPWIETKTFPRSQLSQCI